MNKRLLRVYDQKIRLVAIVENAFDVSYDLKFNEIGEMSFSLVLGDLKVKEVSSFHFVELVDGDTYVGMFRVMPTLTRRSENEKIITYQCEHVLATLIDDILFSYHQLSNYKTMDVLKYILDNQTTKHWRLGNCQFERFFHYSWEHENLLSALFSVPKPFDKDYQWEWDTTSYPWTLNLVEVSNEITGEIRYRKNLKGIEKEENPQEIITRIYPLGYGEGVNQLTIKDVNPTKKYYIEAEKEIIDKYGIIQWVWVDRRFENANSLYESAKSMLDKIKNPKVTYKVQAIDYEMIDPYKLEKYEVGKLVRIHDEELKIVETVRLMSKRKPDVFGNPLDVEYEIGSKTADLGTTHADMERRQRINETYAQGSSSIDSHNYNDNCDPENPAVINFFLPEDLVNINSLTLTYQTEEFRSYSKATKGGGSTTVTSSAGGGTFSSTQAGGGVSKSTSAGGGSYATTSAGGGSFTSTSSGGGTFSSTSSGGGTVATTASKIFGEMQIETSEPTPYTDPTLHVHLVKFTDQFDHLHEVSTPNHSHTFQVNNHSHTVQVNDHVHNFQVQPHTHEFQLDPHAHDFKMDDHSHTTTLPDHVHEVEHGIYRLSEKPSKLIIKVDGNTLPDNDISGENINLIPYLSKDSDGKIKRGRWASIEIYPDKLGRINANVIARVFVQSREGGVF